ncbi:MAG: SIS domain-containing protein [Lachnospiraceae bacterium]|nr:SIS domain-containing protein [Lachnospiraceae bacterium]
MLLGFNEKELEEKKAIHTASEIVQQPDTWKKTIVQMKELKSTADRFLSDILDSPDYDVILTGAGSSEYAGNALCPSLIQVLKGRVRSVGSTDIVTSPELYFSEDRPTLLVSFGRSGNSPESVGAVEVADTICRKVKHVFVTCNENGALAESAKGREDVLSIVLTPETDDEGFAMTSSLTNMYLAALLLFTKDPYEWDDIIKTVSGFVSEGYDRIKTWVDKTRFERIAYLGTDTLRGIAQESCLKVLELTAGKMIAIHDSLMGFRHGPKSIVDDETLCIVYLSDEPFRRRYEMDVLSELWRDKGGSSLIVIHNTPDEKVKELCDMEICLDIGRPLANAQLALPFVVCAQTLALMYSIKLGITPDDPCPTGEVNRVVKGVSIYKYNK